MINCKKAEEYIPENILKFRKTTSMSVERVIKLIRQAQIDSYNQALEDIKNLEIIDK